MKEPLKYQIELAVSCWTQDIGTPFDGDLQMEVVRKIKEGGIILKPENITEVQIVKVTPR